MIDAEHRTAIIDVPDVAFWGNLHRASNSLFSEACWTHCSSYCCKTNNPALNFSLMKCDSAGMIFPLEEYRFLEASDALQTGFAKAARQHVFEFNAERQLSVKFVTSVCSLGGICSNADFRPLICKFYPLYPLPRPDGSRIDDFVSGSMIDQYWDKLGIEHPCWLLRTKSEEFAEAVRDNVTVALGHPYIIFYMSAAGLFARHVSRNAELKHLPGPDTDPRQFFKNWEISYLMGGLVDVPALKIQLTQLYDEIASHFGTFDI